MEAKDFESAMRELLSNHLSAKVKELISSNMRSLALDLNEVDTFKPEATDFILQQPEESQDLVRKVLAEVSPDPSFKAKSINVRFYNLPKTAQFELANIRSKSIDKLIQVVGLIKKVSNVFPSVVSIDYECPSCGHIVNIPQGDNKRLPKICTSCGKSPKQWRTVHEYTIDKQKIVITSTPEDEHARMELLEVIALEDLTDPKLEKRFLPGNRVIISGMLKSRTSLNSFGVSSDQNIFLLASYIIVENRDFDSIVLSDERKKEIMEAAKDPLVYEKFVDSFAPYLYDMRTFKEAVLYQLFGGVTQTVLDKRVRGEIHILLVGDPGVGKSTLAKFAVKVAPKSLYISAKTTSGPGLVGAVTNDGRNNWTVDVGALGLMNKGFLNIDEFDQFNKDDFKVLSEALEHGEVTIQKAASAKWPAEEPVLAEANPKNERFDSFDTVANQIIFPKAILSRFDLIFVIKDIPGKNDREIFKKVALRDLSTQVPFSVDFMRDYIAYARQNCFPTLSDEAEQILEDFYFNVRTKYIQEDIGSNIIPVSARVAESLRRIAQSSARWRLSDIATNEDAARAINIVTEFLKGVGLDPTTGKIDLDRTLAGVTSNKRKAEVLLEVIKELRQGNKASKEEVYIRMEKAGISRDEVSELIELLNMKEMRVSEQFDSFVLV